MIFIGIDPGLGGAIAFLSGEGAVVYDAPVTTGKSRDYLVSDMRNMFAFLPAPSRRAYAVVEQVHAMPKNGSIGSFRLGYGFGLWQGILAALEIPYDLVTPQRWRKDLGIPTGADKSACRVTAQRLFPGLAGELSRVKDDGRADALLLAEWRRRKA